MKRRIATLLAVLAIALSLAAPAQAAAPVTPNISVGCPDNAMCLYTDTWFNGSMYYFLSGPAVVPGACTNLPPAFNNTVDSVINFRNQTFHLFRDANCLPGTGFTVAPLEAVANLGGFNGHHDNISSVQAG